MSNRLRELADIPSAPDWGRRGLSDSACAVVMAALEALLCDRNASGELVAPAAPWLERVKDDYDRSIGVTSLQVRLGMRVLIVLLEWLPLCVLGRAIRMSRLSLNDRVHYFEALEGHRFALLTMLLVATKIPMLVSAFESGDALKLTGYDRPTTSARRRLPVARAGKAEPAEPKESTT